MAKEDINKALEAAQHLENEPIVSDREIAEQYKNDMALAEKAKKLLKPVRDTVSRRKKPSKTAK